MSLLHRPVEKLGVFLIAVIVAAILLIPASAHPGRTDSKGGHHNRSTGEYHYHHGYPEHQHTGGECPYNFDDQTGKNSGGGGSGSSEQKKSATTEKIEAKKKKDNSDLFVVAGYLGLGALLVCGESRPTNKKKKTKKKR